MESLHCEDFRWLLLIHRSVNQIVQMALVLFRMVVPFLHHPTAVSGRWVWPGKMDFSPLFPSPPILILKSQREIEFCWALYFPRCYALTVFKLYLRTGPEEQKLLEPYHLSAPYTGTASWSSASPNEKPRLEEKTCLLSSSLCFMTFPPSWCLSF